MSQHQASEEEDSALATAKNKSRSDENEMAQKSTREHILEVAERIFADEGISNASLRGIIAAADVNTAAVHYHFGSKERLVEAVFFHRAGQIVEDRRNLLEQAVAKQKASERLRAILRAFLGPGLLGGAESPEAARRYARFRARLMTENLHFMKDLMAQNFDTSNREFINALAETLPRFSRDELYWRFHAILGLMIYTMSDTGRIYSISEGVCDPSDHSAALERLVKICNDMLAPGLDEERAP